MLVSKVQKPMSALLAALALFAADAEAAPAKDVVTAETPYPAGAPRDDYGLVSWCYGALRGYLDLYDQAMPEVTRIESAFRRPGSKLEDDLQVYADMRRTGQANLKLYARAIEAAEKASPRAINQAGATAVQKGRSVWAAAVNMPKARLAQEWMSWSLPVRCTPTAEALEQRAKLLGATFDPAAALTPDSAQESTAPAEAS
jgi:hypothetical protein